MKLTTKICALNVLEVMIFFMGCKKEETTPIVITPEHYYLITDKITEVMIHSHFFSASGKQNFSLS